MSSYWGLFDSKIIIYILFKNTLYLWLIYSDTETIFYICKQTNNKKIPKL